MRLHPFLRVLYGFFRITAFAGLHTYYRRRLVLNGAQLRFDGPAIIISNHPSTLTDVLNIGIEVPREMFFLANYGLFKHPVSNWLLRRLFCIPIKRKEDVRAGEDRNNDAAFEQSYQHLEKNGILFIAPEGYSWMNRFVRPLKPGTARIAFGAEARNNWALDLKIIPVGLSYSQPNHFRSEVVMQVGKPVYPRDWQTLWNENPEKAISAISDYLGDELKSLSIHSIDEAGEHTLGLLEQLANTANPLQQKKRFWRSQKMTHTCLQDENLKSNLAKYESGLKSLHISTEGLAAFTAPQAILKLSTEGLRLALGAPFFLIGFAIWFLPCFLPWLLAKRLKLYIGYDSNVKILAGLFIFPIALYAVFVWFKNLFVLWWMGLAGIALAVFLGLFAERYLDVARHFYARAQAGKAAARQPELFAETARMHRYLLQILAQKGCI